MTQPTNRRIVTEDRLHTVVNDVLLDPESESRQALNSDLLDPEGTFQSSLKSTYGSRAERPPSRRETDDLRINSPYLQHLRYRAIDGSGQLSQVLLSQAREYCSY